MPNWRQLGVFLTWRRGVTAAGAVPAAAVKNAMTT
jgi:hypothetical protein